AGEELLAFLEATGMVEAFSVEGLPDGLAFEPESGRIFGKPEMAGEFSLRVRAFGSAGEAMPATVSLIVAPAAGTPVVTAAEFSGRAGEEFSAMLEASPAATGFRAEGLPEGIYLTEAGELAGIPEIPGVYR